MLQLTESHTAVQPIAAAPTGQPTNGYYNGPTNARTALPTDAQQTVQPTDASTAPPPAVPTAQPTNGYSNGATNGAIHGCSN